MKRFALISLIPFLALAACATSQHNPQVVGSTRAVISGVPPSVACVQLVVAAAGNDITRGFDVTPGQDLVAQLDELPVGNVTITAFAFQSNCAGAGTSHPNWASSPTTATILGGQVTNVSLTLEPVGDASVGVHFDVDAGTPSPDMAATPDMAVTPPILVHNPGGGEFGFVVVGAQLGKDIFFTNAGGSPAAIANPSSIFPADGIFSITNDGCNGRVLAPREQCIVSVTFKPTANTSYSYSLVVGAGAVSNTVSLHGTGVPQ
jgi:hypothetical protein